MYSARITRNTPTAFILLLDRSGSTAEKTMFDNQVTTKAVAISTVANKIIRELLNHCRRETGTMDYFDIAAIGYNGDEARMLLGKDFVRPSKLVHSPTSTRIISRQRVMPDGRMAIFDETLRQWIEPLSEGATPMRAALEQALLLAGAWCKRPENRSSYPPTIFNITDGEASDGNSEALISLAEHIRELHTDDGNALIFNVNISTGGGASVIFPSSPDELPESRYTRMLYDMSSEIPVEYNDQIMRLKGVDGSSPFRAMGYNASMTDMIAMLNIGSLSVKKIV